MLAVDTVGLDTSGAERYEAQDMGQPAIVPSATREIAQDEQYRFPYHFLANLTGDRFSQHLVFGSGFEYMAYMGHVGDLLAKLPWRSLLDIGCGEGKLVSMLAVRFADREIAGFDISERAINLAKALNPHLAFSVHGPAIPVDAATCIEVIEHIEPLRLPAFIADIRRRLRKGGTLIATVPSTNRRLNPKHYQHFTGESFTRALQPCFRVREIQHISASAKLIERLMANRLFVFNQPRLLTALYNFYVRHYLHSTAAKGGRVLAICEAV